MEWKIFYFLVLTFICITNAAVLKVSSNKIRYDNYAVYKVKLHNARQRSFIENLTNLRENFNVWHSDDDVIHLMVNPNKINYLKSLTKFFGIDLELMVANVQSLIDAEKNQTVKPADDAVLDWKRYYPLANMEAWLDKILLTYPEVTAGFVIGKSYEGRNIRGIKISYKAGNPGLFIESNIHAREWITSATATWFINELLTSTKTEVRALAENYDWYIVPVLNVDGFAYTHERDRLWRKTRQPVLHSACIGTDPNRNYDSHWMANGGASADPCAENYAGPKAFSEPEIQAMANYIGGIKNKLNILLAFHSYSQLLLSPYGHTATELPPNYADLMSVAKAFADAVQVLPYKTSYRYGTSAGILYTASGATNDWAYNEMDIKLSYTIEFRDEGRFGFVLPPIQILPNCEEAMTGILALVEEAKKLGYLDVKY